MFTMVPHILDHVHNTVQKPDSVLEGWKNYHIFEQTHQLVHERALEYP